jgi:uncharacterized protein YebE (UPF0316 family)
VEKTKRTKLLPERPFRATGGDNRNNELAAIDSQAMERLEDIIEIGMMIIDGRRDDDTGQVFGMGKTGGGVVNEGADIDLPEAVRDFGVGLYEMVGDGLGGHDDICATSRGKRNSRPVRRD